MASSLPTAVFQGRDAQLTSPGNTIVQWIHTIASAVIPAGTLPSRKHRGNQKMKSGVFLATVLTVVAVGAAVQNAGPGDAQIAAIVVAV
jgi:hypothetical protein